MEEARPSLVDIKTIQEKTKDVDTLEFEAVSCFFIPYHSRPRQWTIRLIKSPWFERISMFVIFVNCVTLAMYDPHDKQCQSTVCQILESIEHFVFAFFLAEMLVKMVAMGVTGKKGYMQDKWNRLDCFIVIIGLIEKILQGNNYLTIIRAFRVLRPLRAINKVPSIRILVTLLLDTLPMLGNVLLLSFLIFFVFGIVSVQLWQGKLRNRCFTNFSSGALLSSRYNKSLFYKPSFDEPDFVCSKPLDHGTCKCSDIGSYYQGDKECNGSLQELHTNISSLNSTACVNWNQYYTICKADGPNPFYDTTSFDNIGIAWIAIFQVITLEGWSDIMYFVQDAHSFWNWIYFVVLIVIGSFFLVNLCLVVITMQFQETKAREIELMENSRNKQHDDWAIQAKELMNSLMQCVCSCKTPNKEHVHHHHHHFYHHHHFHHHLYSCFVPPSPNIISNGSNDQTFFHSELPTIQVEAEGSVSTPAETGDVSQTLLSPHEPVSRRSSKTSVCSHTLSIHAEASSAVSIDEIVAQTKASVTLNIPSPATPGVLSFASSSLRGANSSNVPQNETSTSTSVSAEVITQFAHESPKIKDKSMHDLQTKKSGVLVAEKDKELLIKRRLSQPAHVKLDCSRPSHISSWNPPKPSEDIEELESFQDKGSRGSSDKKSENFKPDDCRKNPADVEAKTVGPVKGTSSPPEPSTGPARPTLPRRNISAQSEDEMFESFFDMKQSASYDVASGQGVWHRTRLLCRKITESQRFAFVVMGAIFLNMICMGLEHHNQSDTLTFALETTNIIFVSIFALEMIVKLMGCGLAVYLSQGQNVFDGVIVIVSVIEILLSNGNSSLSIFRSIRLLRIFKLVRPVRYQLLVVIRTMTSVMTFFGLLFLFIFAFAILGMNLFGGKFNFMNSEGKIVTARSNFDNFLWAMVTVFQILTQENWNRVMYDGMRATNKWASLYFVALMSVGYYVLFNLLVAILVEGFTGSGERKSNQKWKRETLETCKPRPSKTGIKKPSILITDGDSPEDCPGSYDYEPVEFCGHGVRNALGTTFNMKSNFNPCLSRASYGRGDCRGCTSGIASSGSGDSKTADNLTMPQLKNLRQASRSIERCNDPSTWDTADQQGVSCKLSHYNPGYLKDGLDLDETADCACFNTPGQAEPCLHTSSVVMCVADDDSTITCEKSGLGLKVLRSSPVHLEDDNDDAVYQLREVAAPVEEAPQSKRKRKTSFRSDWSMYLLPPSNRFRRRLVAICEHKFFDYAVLLFILLSCVVLALEEPHIPSDSRKRQIIDVAMFILTVVFTVEMMMKIVAQGFVIGPGTYLKDGWNVLDFILVLVSWIDVGITYSSATAPEVLGALKVFRALRTLRPLRMIRRAPGLKLVVQTLLYSLKPIGNTVLIAAIFFTMFAILGVQIFKGTFHYCHGDSHVRTKAECRNSTNGRWKNYMYNFDNLPKALISLFVFSTRDGWVEIMHHGIDAVGIDMQPIKNYAEWRLVYFIPFLMLGGFLMLNMIVGVVVENFQRCRERMEEEERQRRKKRLLEKVKNKNKEEEDRSYYDSYSKLRKRVHDVCLHLYWDVAIAIVICLNVLCMSLEHYQMSQTFVIFVETANYFFTGVFVLEVIFKFIAFGFVRYFKDRWNLVDLLIVIFSLAGIIIESLSSTRRFLINPTVARTFRVLRIIRVLKLVKLAKGVRSLLDTLFEALPQVANLGLLFLLLFFIYSCLGIQLFGTIECSHPQPCHGLGTHAHFSDFGTAMLTLFRIATGDNWNGILEDTLSSECSRSSECEKYCCISKYTAPLFFVTFVLAAQFVLVNVVIAVLMKHLKESKENIAAKMAAKDLEKKLRLLTQTAKNFIRNKARKSEVPVTRSRSIVELGLGGIELAQLKNYTPEEQLQDSFSTDLSRADVIFQEFLRLNANLKKVQMRLVRTSSYKVEMPSSPSVTHSRCRRRNTISEVRELDKRSANPSRFTEYKSGTKL